jgi:hypothetical protein
MRRNTALGFALPTRHYHGDPGRTAIASSDRFDPRFPLLIRLLGATVGPAENRLARAAALEPPCQMGPPIVRCSSEENGMPGTEKFMADLLAIIASTEQSEDQQIDAATKLAMAYTADLKDSPDQWIGKASGDLGLISAHKAIIAEQNRRPAKSPAWRVLHAAENVIGDQKINLRPPARGPARKSRP